MYPETLSLLVATLNYHLLIAFANNVDPDQD